MICNDNNKAAVEWWRRRSEGGRQQSTVTLEYLYYDWVGDTSSIGISGISYIMIIIFKYLRRRRSGDEEATVEMYRTVPVTIIL